MSANQRPCSECTRFSAISIAGGRRHARHGWCTLKSVYPYDEKPGEVIPEGVRRAAPGERPKPHIVVGHEVQKSCTDFRPLPPAKGDTNAKVRKV